MRYQLRWKHAGKMIGVAVLALVLLPIYLVPMILYISGCLLTETEPRLFRKQVEEKT